MQLPELKTISLLEFQADVLPETPGVYVFRDGNNNPLYVGKAKNLKNRVSSYFVKGITHKVLQMRLNSKFLSYFQVASELEALLLEAKLVRTLMPFYNSELKDDKSPLYIGITKEAYPRIVPLRKTELSLYPLKNYFGPFTQAGNVRRLMRFLRKAIPYSQHKPGKRPCIYSQIGLCLPCPSEIEIEEDLIRRKKLKKAHSRNVSQVRKFLSGELKSVRADLIKQMKEYSSILDFESAELIKSRIAVIDHININPTLPIEYIKDPLLLENKRIEETEDLKSILGQFYNFKQLERIECFDNAHLGGTHPTASMVTFINGEADKKYYRHFKIKKARGDSDVDMMREIMERRKKHFEDLPAQTGWEKPDLIIVDGGKPQVSTALEVIGNEVPLIGLAKREETLVIKIEGGFKEIRLGRRPALYLVQRLRDEAHRFARRLHHKHVSKAILTSGQKK